MRRREFITLTGAAATLPLAAHAQSVIPTIGCLGSETAELFADRLAAFRQPSNCHGNILLSAYIFSRAFLTSATAAQLFVPEVVLPKLMNLF